MHDLIELAGGASITASVDIENPILSDEFVLSANPEIIIGSFGGDFEISELLSLHPTWYLVDAIQTEQVYSVDENLLLRAGPRVVDGAEELFSRIHPTAPSGCTADLQ
jgi:iron complex transport system substrate-binding protein